MSYEVYPGVGIGSFQLGTRYDDLILRYGEMEKVIVFNRLAQGRYGPIELVLSSSENNSISEDAIVIAIGLVTSEVTQVQNNNLFIGARKDQITKAHSSDSEEHLGILYFTSGFSVKFDTYDKAIAIGVYPEYEIRPNPPKMKFATRENE